MIYSVSLTTGLCFRRVESWKSECFLLCLNGGFTCEVKGKFSFIKGACVSIPLHWDSSVLERKVHTEVWRRLCASVTAALFLSISFCAISYVFHRCKGTPKGFRKTRTGDVSVHGSPTPSLCEARFIENLFAIFTFFRGSEMKCLDLKQPSCWRIVSLLRAVFTSPFTKCKSFVQAWRRQRRDRSLFSFVFALLCLGE